MQDAASDKFHFVHRVPSLPQDCKHASVERPSIPNLIAQSLGASVLSVDASVQLHRPLRNQHCSPLIIRDHFNLASYPLCEVDTRHMYCG